jgi:hypothetical protein
LLDQRIDAIEHEAVARDLAPWQRSTQALDGAILALREQGLDCFGGHCVQHSELCLRAFAGCAEHAREMADYLLVANDGTAGDAAHAVAGLVVKA